MSAITSQLQRILIVEPNGAVRAALVSAVGSRAVVEADEGFESARARLHTSAYDLLVTNLRLGEYNGIHLVILVKHANPATTALVYADQGDLPVAFEAQRAGAFFELAHRMPVALPSYVGSVLPNRDRRRPERFDRRTHPRGGRRIWDVHRGDSASST